MSGANEMRVAYTMSRFPKLSETFVLNEMIVLEALGADVVVYPLVKHRQAVIHQEVERWMRKVRYVPFVSLGVLRANVYYAVREPVRYWRTLAELIRYGWGSGRVVLSALAIMPKSVRFAFEMQRMGVRHLHAHFATHPAVAALVVNRLTGIPFSFTAHGSDVYVERRLLPQKVKAARFVIAISEYAKKIIVNGCGEEAATKVHVVHCGVDPTLFAPSGVRASPEVLEIACVATFEEKKGHRFLIKACAELRRRGLQFRLHLVGDGPLRNAIERQIDDADLSESVVLHGGKPRHEVAQILASSDIVVLASHPTTSGKMEGIPVALMEAMACARPVVATIMSGIPELVQHDREGLLVSSGDPDALADALARLWDPDLRARLGDAARVKVLAEFDLRANAERLYRLIVDGSAHGANVD
jgi:colanic acid/amylovoran biosynthesis glycosyltransferase